MSVTLGRMQIAFPKNLAAIQADGLASMLRCGDSVLPKRDASPEASRERTPEKRRNVMRHNDLWR